MIREREALFKKASYIVDKINRKMQEKKITQEELWKKMNLSQASINQYLTLAKMYSNEKYYIRMLEALEFNEIQIKEILLEARRIKNNAENWVDISYDDKINNFLKMSEEEKEKFFLDQIALSVKWINREAFKKDLQETINFFINKYK